MIVVALLASALAVGLTPLAGGTSPAALSVVPPGVATASEVWYSDFGTGVDGMAVDPGTGRAFVRTGATLDGADLLVAGPSRYIEPDRLTGPYGYPVAADGSIFVYRAGMLRRMDPTSLAETGSWTVPGLTANLLLTTAGGDIVWVTRQSDPERQEQLYRFDPDTGTTSTSGPTDLRYTGPVGGGSQLVGWGRSPERLVAFTGTEAGPAVDVSSKVHEVVSADVSGDGALVTVPDFPEDRAVEFSMPGFVPTGTEYVTDGHPVLVASTTAAGGSLAIVSAPTSQRGWTLRVYARGNPNAAVDVSLPAVGWVPQFGDLTYSGDGKRLFFLVRDRAGSSSARLVVADLATTVYSGADPLVVGSKGGAEAGVTASLGPGTQVTVGGVPVASSVVVQGGPVRGTHDRITFAVPAMEPGIKPVVLTNALGHVTSGGAVRVVDLGPYTTSPWFVRVQIYDVTGKKATTQQITAGIAKLAETGSAGGFIADLEAARGQMTTSAALIRLYRAVFLRPPDTGGLTYWLDRMDGGTRLVQVAASFAGSREFRNRYGSLPDDVFVDQIYQNVLGRHADPSGRAYWVKKLGSGTSRGVLVAQFAQSGEYVTKSTVDVQRIELRLAMLDKTPTEAQLAPLRSLALDDVAVQFLNDPAYKTAG